MSPFFALPVRKRISGQTAILAATPRSQRASSVSRRFESVDVNHHLLAALLRRSAIFCRRGSRLAVVLLSFLRFLGLGRRISVILLHFLCLQRREPPGTFLPESNRLASLQPLRLLSLPRLCRRSRCRMQTPSTMVFFFWNFLKSVCIEQLRSTPKLHRAGFLLTAWPCSCLVLFRTRQTIPGLAC